MQRQAQKAKSKKQKAKNKPLKRVTDSAA